MKTVVSQNIDEAVTFLVAGEVVAIPTETVYGLAANIYNEQAIKKIFEVKQRPLFNPLIVHLHDPEQLDELVENVPREASVLAEKFWPGSLTLILKKRANISDLITAGKDTVAVRIPNHALTLELLKKLPFPIAAPSANPFNRISPTKAEHVNEYFNGIIPMVLDGGNCENGLESTIVGFDNGQTIIYRLGAISKEDIERVVGPVALFTQEEHAPQAPGMLAKHYSPRTPLVLTDDLETAINRHADSRVGVLCFQKTNFLDKVAAVEVLSATGDLHEAGANLYSALHRLDKLNLDIIIAQKAQDSGLGRTMNDRLQRASVK